MNQNNQDMQVQKIEREVIGNIEIPQELINSMQKAIELCIPANSKAMQTINDSIVIGNGLNELRKFFQNDEVKKLVQTMQDTTVGFLTDREPMALAKANAKKTPQWRKEPYTYEEIVEALIPPMLEGYRFTGNEINVIAGNGMPVKKGKYRRINEMVDSFVYFIGTPVRADGLAKIRCQARWVSEGKEKSIGYTEEDKCIIMIDIGQYDGIDKIIGLSESKLFSRVLTKASGKLIIEGDVPHDEPKDVTPEVDENEKSGKNIMEDDVAGDTKQDTTETEPEEQTQIHDINWSTPTNEEGLQELFGDVQGAYPDKKDKLKAFLVKEPIDGRPLAYFDDFIDKLKKVVN